MVLVAVVILAELAIVLNIMMLNYLHHCGKIPVYYGNGLYLEGVLGVKPPQPGL